MARVAERLRDYSLDGQVAQHENISVIEDMFREAEVIFRQSYQANNYADQVMKVLTLGLERGELVIVGERTISKM